MTSDDFTAQAREKIRHILGYCSYTPQYKTCEHLPTGSLRDEKEIDEIMQLLTQTTAAATKAKDIAYWERNQLVAFLASQYDSHMVRHPDGDKDWEDDWRWIVCVHTPAGQMTWHIHNSEIGTFSFLLVEPDSNHWDGHTTGEKYKRLAELRSERQAGTGEE